MCVTTALANLGNTSAYTYATLGLDGPQAWHVTGYQNTAMNRADTPNCMLLHFPGDQLQLVRGPENTQYFMRDLMVGLPELEPRAQMRGSLLGTPEVPPVVEAYGDYHVVVAQSPGGILEALDQVPINRRPPRGVELEKLVAWYGDHFPDYAFVLACFDDRVQPEHPIVVRYVPHSDDVLFIPGLEAHSGAPPALGQPSPRGFTVAFAAESHLQQCSRR